MLKTRKVYFVAEDAEILDKLKTEFKKEKDAEFLSTTDVSNLKDTDLIIGVSKNPYSQMKSKDYHMFYSNKVDDFKTIVKNIHRHLYGYKKFRETLQGIEEGSLNVMFCEYSFGGGHRDDIHIFDLNDRNGKTIGKIELLDLDGFCLFLDGKIIYCNDWTERIGRVNQEERDYLKEVICNALIRDDKEYTSLCFDERGGVMVPFYFYDLTREEILRGDYNEELPNMLQPILG